jgi:hypothetical protein
MYIILKQSTFENDEVLNVFYCDDLTLIRNWVKDTIEDDIVSYRYAPNEKHIKYVTYELNDGDKNFQLLKKYKRIHPGYVYNSSELITEVFYTITILEFDSNKPVRNLESSEMWRNINSEVNNRVLKQLDKESLFQVFCTIQEKIGKKRDWNRTEFIGVLSETLRNFRKELYSSIAKRLKRFGRKQSLYKKNTKQQNIQEVLTSCKIEALKGIDSIYREKQD